MARQFKTFKQLVKQLSEVKTTEDLWAFYGEVDMSYQHEKITYQDNEMLYHIPVRTELINGN